MKVFFSAELERERGITEELRDHVKSGEWSEGSEERNSHFAPNFSYVI
jgi:hypothetical protein